MSHRSPLVELPVCLRGLRVHLHLVDVTVWELPTSVALTLDFKVLGHFLFSAVPIRHVTSPEATSDLK
jgi:hypothetical protein